MHLYAWVSGCDVTEKDKNTQGGAESKLNKPQIISRWQICV